jgi:hypothetical protein
VSDKGARARYSPRVRGAHTPLVELDLLELTSPPIRGGLVRELQLMLRHNPYGTFEPGSTEGVYDEQTAAAVRRAKYWLGYPESKIDERTDAELRALLGGEVQLPPAWRRARARRLGRARESALWNRAFQVAVDEIGRRDDPRGSKRTPYTHWYGVLAPFPVVFCSFCYAQAGSNAFAPLGHYAYAPYLLDDARRARNELSVTSDPLRGDLALIDTKGDGIPDRACLFDDWMGDPGTVYEAIEGDVGFEGEVSGDGAVARVKRIAAETVAFVHVRG